MGPVEPLQMNIYQSNTYKKELSWLYFNDKPSVQERQQVKNQQLHIRFCSLSNNSSSNWEHQPDITTVFHAWPYGRFIEIQSNLRRKKLHTRNQGSNFLGGSYINRDNVRAPIQYGRERVNPSILKDDFSSRTDPSIFTSIAPVLRN